MTTRRAGSTAPARARTRREIGFLVLKWSAITGLLLAALGAVTVALVFWVYGRDPNLPAIRSLSDYKPRQVSRILASDGTVVGELFSERRTYVPYEEIPDTVVKAFISAEDAGFFEHQGIDYWGMLRALFVNVRAGKTKQGASTITQQVVKTFLLSPERTLRRKIQEIVLARRLEKALTKEEILALYLNQIYFGHGRYGVQEASRFYFGKDVKDLNPGEAALVAGLPQSPENISPKKAKNQERAKNRQKYVLEQMVHNGYLSEDVARTWINEPIRIVRDPYPDIGTAPEWIEVVRQELIATHGEARIDSLGAVVTTTLDPAIQAAAAEALREGLRGVDARQKYGRPVRSVKPDKIELEVAKLARKLPKGGPKRGEHYLAVVREVHDQDSELAVDLGKWEASVLLGGAGDARFNPPSGKSGHGKSPSERFQPGDVIRVEVSSPAAVVSADPDGDAPDAPAARGPRHSRRRVELASGPQGAVVVLDPRTRRVLAMVGGYATRASDFNRAVQARRQPGSTFKPLVYAAAIDSRVYTPASIINDAPEVYDLWKPENYKKGAFEGPVRLRYALAKSINTVAIRVLSDIGGKRASDLAHAMGIRSELPETLSLALGSGEVTPLELTNAFATLAAGGAAAEPQFLASIGDQPVAAAAATQALGANVAFVAMHMMTSVVEEGTARKAASLGMPVAGKTGTSNDARDAWFMGITPSYVVGVWIGFDDNQSLGRGESGGTTALPVFVDLMQAIGKDERRLTFAIPEGVSLRLIDKASGLLAPEGAPADAIYTEVFVAGTEPTETALPPDQDSAASFITNEYDEYEDGEEGGSGTDAGPPGSPRGSGDANE